MNQKPFDGNTKILKILFITYLLIGLWPFDFFPKNEVQWLKEGNGVHFYGRGIISSPAPANNPSFPLFRGGPVTIELWFQPDTEPASSLPRILSIYDAGDGEDFFIGQWKSGLILRKRILNAEGKVSYQEVGVAKALPLGQKRFIAITSDRLRTSVYIDGNLEKHFPNFTLVPIGWRNTKQIILGNSPTGKEYWKGILFGLAIYHDSLSPDIITQNYQNWTSGKPLSIIKSSNQPIIFPFAKSPEAIIKDQLNRHTLLMPNKFQIIQKVILEPPWKDFRWKLNYFEDILINIIGFFPFGFFAFAWARNKFKSDRNSFLWAITLGFLLSFLIELTQTYLPSRSSQLLDILTNLLGTFLGTIIFRSLQSRLV